MSEGGVRSHLLSSFPSPLVRLLSLPARPSGHGQRRNPYDGITTAEGLTLRQVAAKLPSLPDAPPASHHPAPGGKRSGARKRELEALALVADRMRDVLGQLDTLGSSCVICYQVGRGGARGSVCVCGGGGFERQWLSE